jgi:hypothetical protein
MNPTKNKYPFFEVNQVLTHEHLNHAVDYLDEQERLTRANLMGMGIVCGLEVTYTDTTITISKGCGITSEGYLLIEPEEPNDVKLLSYRKYESPTELAYSQFKNKELWELLPSSSESSNLDKDFLSDKVVLLFLELTKKDMCNCSPTDCDDKGSEITATVKRLLICKDSISKATTDLISCKHELSNLRLPRYSLSENDSKTSSVLKTFHNVFCTNKLVTKLEQSLTSAYVELKPILQNLFPENPFTNFKSNFGFLEDNFDGMDDGKKYFLQYYYGFFDDLIKAYDEFRWRATALSCPCCPSEELFPRHLMLGLASKTASGEYRQNFLASSTISNYEEDRKAVVHLFNRLVKMINEFSYSPLVNNAKLQIRITPSKSGDVPLSEKAIPYYYKLNDQPTEPLFKLWNAEKTRRNLAHENLSYHWDKYHKPVPDFVSHPLRYDLESYNFLRIEGHLGEKRQEVEEELLKIKEKYRLPIDIITLCTGQSLQDFLKNHPGIQHKAGVSLGGTFILVYDDSSKVIADFFLPYRVEKHQCNCINEIILVLLILEIILVALLNLLDVEIAIAIATWVAIIAIIAIAKGINDNKISTKIATLFKKEI